MLDELLSDAVGVRHVSSYIVLGNIKQVRTVPIGLLEPSLQLAAGM
jgi:hypothetical protein